MATYPQRPAPAPPAAPVLLQAPDVAGTVHAVRQEDSREGWPMALCGWIVMRPVGVAMAGPDVRDPYKD